jgi:hypothetical protein
MKANKSPLFSCHEDWDKWVEEMQTKHWLAIDRLNPPLSYPCIGIWQKIPAFSTWYEVVTEYVYPSDFEKTK